MLQSSSLFRHFHIQPGHYEAPMSRMFRTELTDIIESNGLAAVVGPPGAGKTHLIGEVKALMADRVIFADLVDLTDRTIRITSILSDLVQSISDESPRRSSASLSRQVIRLLGQAVVAQGRRVCLIIDDAQRLHPATLTSLKMLRERDFAGQRPLLSIILSGWPELAATIERRKDISWRTELLLLTEQAGWMTLQERVRYLTALFGDAIEEGARLTIAARCRVPEEMNAFVMAKMREARQAGLHLIDARTVAGNLLDMVEKLGIRYPEIAKEMGKSTTTAHRAVHDGPKSPHHKAARNAIQKIARRLALPKAS